VLCRRRRANLPAWVATARDIRRAVRGEADPATGSRDNPGGCAPRAGDPLPHCRGRTAHAAAGRTTTQRRARPLGPIRASSGRTVSSRLRARHLRYHRQGAARDPEQGIPGARLRHAPRHGRYTCGARTARPSGDAAALADAIRRLADDAELASRLGAGGRATYEAKASEVVLGARWRGIIERLL
jgi:hypothetical protein